MGGRLWVPVLSGLLARYAAGYGSWLSSRGYSRWTVSHRLWQLELLSRWVEREGLSPAELTLARVREFLVARRAAGYSLWLSVRSTALPLEYLRELGVVPAEMPAMVVEDPLERLLADYARYLLDERGLTEHTVFARYVPAARLFLTSRVAPDVSALTRCRCELVYGGRVSEAQRVGGQGSDRRAAVVVALPVSDRRDPHPAGVGGTDDRGSA